VNLEALAAELLGQPLDQFTAHRNARMKELKASGQADLARELAALKKPSLPLWATNKVDRTTLDGLRSAAQAVASGQAGAATGRPDAARDLRAASEEFQRRLEAAGVAGAGVLRQGGHAAADETVRRMREILRLAALEGGETWDRLRKGSLTTEPRPHDDMLEMFGAGGAPPAAGRQAEQAEARRAAELAQRAARADEELAERATQMAQRLRQEAAEAAVAARRSAERAAAAEDEAARARAQAKKSQRAAGRQRIAKRA
jgi:hypothetical protein